MTRLELGPCMHRGTLTEVHVARGPDGPCVVKLARADAAAARIADEISVLACLKGPPAPELLGRVQWQGREGFAMSFAGRALERLQAEAGPPTDLQLAALAAQLAEALTALAAARGPEGRPLELVHRDLTPANVLVDAAARVRVVDFGNAWYRGRSAQTQVGRVFGTEGFMAPEQAAGGLTSPATDVYAAACVLADLRRPGAPPAGWSDPIGAWVQAALQTSPGDRPPPQALAERARARIGAEPAQAVLRTWISRAGPAPSLGLGERLGEVELEPFDPPTETVSDAPRPPAIDLFMGLGETEPAPARTRVALPEGESPADPMEAEPTALADPPPEPATTVEPRGDEPTRIDPAALRAPSGLPALDEGPSLSVGDEVFGYRLEVVLGRGQSGQVFGARHPVLGTEAAVKVLHPAAVESARAVERFFREARALAQLEHPNVVRVHTCGRSPSGAPFLVMERVPGPSLREHMQEVGPMPPEALGPLLREIALGLYAAHEAGLVHRDLKPANVLLTRAPVSPRIKIVDFGLAQLSGTDPITRTKDLLGTPAYMAPEQIRSSRDVDGRADLYALGALAYHALTGRRPFSGTALAVMRAQLERPPPPMSPQGPLDDLVLALLAKDPAARPASGLEVAREIDARLGPVEPTRITAPPRARRRGAAPLLATTALVAAGTIAGILIARRPAPEAAVEVPAPAEAPRPVAAPSPPSEETSPSPVEPPAPPRRARSRPPAAPARRAQTVAALAAQAGLRAADLSAVAGPELAAYRTAPGPAGEREVLRAAEDPARLGALLERRLREAKAELRARAAASPRASEWESRWLDLRERASGAEDAPARRALLTETAALRRSISAAATEQ